MADKNMENSPKNGSVAPNEGAGIKPSTHSKMTLLRQQMEENRKKLQRREQEISHSKRNLEQLMGSFEGMERSLSISSMASDSEFSFSEPRATAKIVKDVTSTDDSKSLANEKDSQILKSKLAKVEEEKKRIRDDYEKRYRTLDELNKANEEKCSKLKAENALLSEKVRLFALSTDKLEEENRKLKDELNDKEDEKELGQIEVETRYNHLLKEHQQLQDRFHYLHEELNGKHQLISDWKTRYQSLEETYQEMSNRYQALSEQSKLESAEQSENDQLWKSRYHLLESELESVIEKNTESEKNWKSHFNELNTLIQSLETDKAKHAKDQEKCEALQSEISSYHSEAGRFTQLLMEHEALSKEFQTLKDAYEKQSEDYGALTQKYHSVTQANGLPSPTSPAGNDTGNTKAKNQRGKKKAKKFSEIVQQSAENVENELQIPSTDDASKELTALKSQLENALRSKESLETEIQALTTQFRQEFQELSESLLSNVDKLQQSEELIRNLNDRLNAVEAQKPALTRAVQETVSVEPNEDWKTEKCELEASLSRLEQELAKKEDEISRLKLELTEWGTSEENLASTGTKAQQTVDENWTSEKDELEASLSRLEQELAKKEGEIGRLKLELTEWGTSEENVASQDVDKFEKDLANLEAQLALKDGELEDANQELATLRTELEELRAQTGDEVGSAQGEIFKLSAKMKDLEYWLSERTTAVQTLEETLQAKEKLIQELKMQIEVDARTLRNAEEQLADDEANRQVVEERLEAKEAEAQRLQQALQKLQTGIQTLESQLTEKSAEISRLSDDLQEAEQVLHEKDVKIKALFEENRELKIERDNNAESFNSFTEIVNRCQALESQLHDKEDQLQKLQSYNNLSVAHVQEAEGSRQVFESQYQALEQEMNQTRSVLSEKEDALEKLTEKYKKVAAVLKQKLVVIQNLEVKLKSQPATKADFSQEKFVELESTYNQISSELQQRQVEVSALRDELRAKDEIFASSEQDLRSFYEEQLEKMRETLQSSEKDFEKRLNHFSTELGTLQQSLEESQSLVEELRQEAESNKAVAAQLQRQCDEAKAAESQLRALEATSTEIPVLQNKLASLEGSYNQILADLDQSRLEIETLHAKLVAKDQILAVSEQDLRHAYEEQLSQLHQRLAETEEAWKGRLSEAEQEIVTLQHDLEKSTALVHHLTQECDSSRLRAEQVHSKHEESQHRISTLESQLTSMQENLAITQNYLKDAEKETEVLSAELYECKTHLETRKNELLQAQQYIETLASTPNYAVELQQMQDYNQQLESQLKSLEEQLKYAQENEHRLGERVRLAEQSLSEILSKNEAELHKNAALSETLQTFREKLGVAEEESGKLRQELEQSQEKVNEAQIEAQQSRATHEALQQELSLLRIQTEQVAVLEQELFEVRGALADALQKNEETQARMLQLQEMAVASDAEKELEAVKLQWEESRRGHEYYYQECQNLFAQLEYTQADVARLQAELEASEAGRIATVQELEELRIKSEEFASQLSSMSVAHQQRQEELDRVNESFSQYRINTTSQLNQCHSAVQLMRNAYAELKSWSESRFKQGQQEMQHDLAVVLGKWRELEADCHQMRTALQQERRNNAAQVEALQHSSDYNLAQWQTAAAELERVKNSPEMTQSVEELNAQLLESQKSVEYYTQEWHNQNAQLWHLDGLLRTAQQESEEAKTQKATQLQEISDLKTQLEIMTQEQEKMLVANREQLTRVSELQKEIAVLQKYQQDFESQTETLVDTQKLLDELRQSSVQNELQSEQHELELNALRSQLVSAQQSRDNADSNAAKLHAEIRVLQGQLERLQVDLSELQSSVASKAQQIEYYQTEWQNALGQVDSLKSDLSLLRSREDSSTAVQHEVVSLRQQQQELQQKCLKLEEEARLAGIAHQDLNRVNEDLKRVTEDLSRSLEAQTAKETELLAAVTECEEKFRNSEQTAASLQNDNIHLRGMLTQAEEDKRNLQSQMDQMQAQITALQNQAGHVETSTENLSNQVRNLQAALQEKEAQFTALTQDFERLQRDRRNLQQVCNLLEEEKEELEAKLAALELDKETWEADVVQLKDRNETLQADMIALREESVQKKESVPLQQAVPDNRLVEELEELLNASRQESERMAAELQSTKVKSAKLLRQVKQLQAEREKFQASAKAADDPLQQLAQEEMQSQIDQANQSSKELKDKLTQLQTERDRLVAQLDVLHAAQENYLEHKERLEAENVQLFQSNKALSATVTSLEWKISELEENLQSLKSTPTKEKSDTTKPEEETEVVEEPVVASKAWETTNDATQEKDDKEVVQLREEIASLLEEKAQLAQENEEFQDVLDEFKLEVDRLKADNDFYIDIVRQLSMTGTLSPSTVARLKDELQSSNVDLDASLSDEDYANEPNYWQKTLNDLQMEVEFLRSRNSMMMSRLKEAGMEVEEDFSEEGNAETLELAQLKAALDTAMKNLHERDVRCQELGWEISKLMEERDTLQIRLSDALRQLYGKVVPVVSEAEWQEDLERKLRAIKDASVQIDRNMQAYGKNARDMGDKLQRPSPGTTALLAQWLRGKSLHRVQHV